MIRALFLLLLPAVSTLSALAQRPFYRPQVHEIALQLGEVHQIPTLASGYASGSGAAANVVNGLWYKGHITYQHAVRAGLAYRTAKFDYPGRRDRFVSYSASRNDFDGFLGYELGFPAGRAKLTAGFDFIATRSLTDEKGIEPGINADEYLHQSNLWRLGGRGALGFHWFFSPYASFTVEAGPYYQKALDGGSADAPFTLFPSQEFGVRAAALLSVHFKPMKKRCSCPRH